MNDKSNCIDEYHRQPWMKWAKHEREHKYTHKGMWFYCYEAQEQKALVYGDTNKSIVPASGLEGKLTRRRQRGWWEHPEFWWWEGCSLGLLSQHWDIQSIFAGFPVSKLFLVKRKY